MIMPHLSIFLLFANHFSIHDFLSITTIPLGIGKNLYFHFIDEAIETQWRCLYCPNSHSWDRRGEFKLESKFVFSRFLLHKWEVIIYINILFRVVELCKGPGDKLFESLWYSPQELLQSERENPVTPRNILFAENIAVSCNCRVFHSHDTHTSLFSSLLSDIKWWAINNL